MTTRLKKNNQRVTGTEWEVISRPYSVAAFWQMVDKSGDGPNGDCWIWTGCLLVGYGLLNRRPYGKYLAHRFSWAIHNNQLPPKGLDVMHTCDNPPCVNPDHLVAGTRAENIADCVSKNRHGYGYVWGEKIGNSKLTADQVREIRALYGSQRTGYIEIAKKYGVSNTLIGYIIRGQIWTNLQPE